MRRVFHNGLGFVLTLAVCIAHGVLIYIIVSSLLVFFGIDLQPVFDSVDQALLAVQPGLSNPAPWRLAVLATPFVLIDLIAVYIAARTLPAAMTLLVILPIAGLLVVFGSQRFDVEGVDLSSVLIVVIIFTLYAMRLIYARSVVQ